MKYGRKYQKLLNVGITRIKNGSLQDIIVEFSVGFDHFTKVHRISTPLLTSTVNRFYEKQYRKSTGNMNLVY